MTSPPRDDELLDFVFIQIYIFNQNQGKRRGERGGTWKVREESGVRLIKVVLLSGTDECIIHANDSHMFRLSESPTNITRFPLHLFKNACPSNLH